MSAARRKGKWVGGGLILGYDVDAERRRLVVNEGEANEVRAIFALYIEKQSILATADELNRRGWPRKTWQNKDGSTSGGRLWNKPNLLGLLQNVAYVGKVNYRGEIHGGEHEAILDEETWARAQAILTRNARDRGTRVRNKSGALLRGLLVCGSCGCAMSHTYTEKGSTRYRYYVCQQAMKRGWQNCATRSIPAGEIEKFVLERIATIGRDPELAAEVARQARMQYDHQTAALRDEKAGIDRSLREQARTVAGIVCQPNAAARLADLQDQIRAGENRLSGIAIEAAALGDGRIDDSDVAAALGRFDETVEALTPVERARMVELLVERVAYNREKGTIAITFRPTGIKAISEGAK
jgi:site-specific DNA recombinase